MNAVLAAAAIVVIALPLMSGTPSRGPRRPAAPAQHPDRDAPRTRGRPPFPADTAVLVDQLGTLLLTGIPLPRAWETLARTVDDPALRELAAVAAAGADPSRAAPATVASDPAVRALVITLRLAERTGAAISPLLTGLGEALHDLHDAELARRSAFAGPRATAMILLALPLLGVGLGFLVGADPMGTLLGTVTGRGLLLAGIVLTALGWWWMGRLLHRASGPSSSDPDPSLLLDLVAAPLATGLPLAPALHETARAIGEGPIAAELRRGGDALASGLGVDRALAGLPPALQSVRRTAVVCAESGADPVPLLRSAARADRRGRARQAEAEAARLAVRLVLPTGLALLPAFIVLGIVPTVISLLDRSLGVFPS